MLLLSSTSSIRVITASAAMIEVHASAIDVVDSTGAPSLAAPINTPYITTATTTTVVPSPAAGSKRNVKHLNITNAHASQSCRVVVDHFDGTTAIELMGFTLLPGENMIFNEEGRWAHRDAQGAEYPPAGKGAFDGWATSFFKNGSTMEGVGNWYCTSKDGGFPGAWSPGAPGVNGRVTDGTTAADAGVVLIRNPALGANYLTEVQMASTVNHTHVFFDVLWVNTGLVVTTTTAQAITMPTLPPRDINGTSNGEGCSIALLFTAAATNAAVIANTTISYTNSDGVAGRTATLTAVTGSQIPATPVIGTLIWFNLAAGDKGVRSIQSITLGTSLGAGSISLMVTRDISQIGTTIPNVSASKVAPSPGVRLFNGTAMLHCCLASATTATTFAGEITVMEK